MCISSYLINQNAKAIRVVTVHELLYTYIQLRHDTRTWPRWKYILLLPFVWIISA
jgi:hypothetical protein